MDLRRERKKDNYISGIVITVASLCAAAAMAVFISYLYDNDIDLLIENADSRATNTSHGITALFDDENAADEFSYEIKQNLNFESSDSEAKLFLKNPSVNRYIMQLELVCGDETVLKTGNIAPGQIIKEVKLDIELSKGEYDATAYIYAVDPESYKTVGMVTQPITINIKS